MFIVLLGWVMSKAVNRRQFTASLSPELFRALYRLRAASGTPISKLLEQFMDVEVLDSISESLEMAKKGDGPDKVMAHMSALLGRHILGLDADFKKPEPTK